MNEIIAFVQSVGFPIVACVYMARTFRAELQAQTEAVNKLISVIDGLNDRLDRLEARVDRQD